MSKRANICMSVAGACTHWTACLLLIVILLLSEAISASAQSVPMMLTGVLIRPDDEISELYPYFEISMDGEVWKMRIRDVEVRTAGNHDPAALRHFGRFLFFVGPDSIMEYLQSDAAEGLPLRFEGRLYYKRRTFMLSAVNPVSIEGLPDFPQQEECPGVCPQSPESPVQQW